MAAGHFPPAPSKRLRHACPTLLIAGSESFLPDPERAGVLGHFRQAELVKIEGAGHWVQHDKPAEVIEALKTFLEGLPRSVAREQDREPAR